MTDQNHPAHPPANQPGNTPDFTPVPRQRHHASGWTPEKQCAFIGALGDTGSVSEAAKMAGMSARSAYRLRRSPGGEGFAHAWELAIRQASRTLADIAFERAVKGVEDPVFDREGQCTHVRRKYNDRLLMFLLRAHNPAQYGQGDERIIGLDKRAESEDWAAGLTPLSAVLEVLAQDAAGQLEEGPGEGAGDNPAPPSDGEDSAE